MFVRFLPALLVVTPLGSAAIHAADWPTFRGNSLQSGVAASPLPEKLDVLWKIETKDAVEATAAIVGDTVYIATMGTADGHLIALNLADGKEKWRYKGGPFKASPAVKDSQVYIGDMDGVFHCVDAATGTKRWTFDTGSEIIPSANFAGDRVLFGSSDEHLHCLDAKSGKPLWKFKVPGGPINPSPAIVEGRVFASGCDSTLHIIDVAEGKEVASVELPAPVAASPAVSGDYLYVGYMDQGVVTAIDWKKARILWQYEPEGQPQFYSSPAVKDNLVVIGGRDRMVHALDSKTGKLAWSFDTRKKVDSSPVIVGDRVFVGSGDGSLYALDLKKGTRLWDRPLGAPITASPAVGGNRLVIGTEDGTVYCFGGK